MPSVLKRFLPVLAALALATPALAQVTAISALPSATIPLGGSEYVPVVQSGQTRKAPASAFGFGGGWSANPFCSTAGGANPCLKYGTGIPANSSDPAGSLYLRTDSPQLFQQVLSSTTVPAVVQGKSAASSSSVTFATAPLPGDLLLAHCGTFPGMPGIGTGWTDSGSTSTYTRLVYKIAGPSETALQTPCTGAIDVSAVEVSGVLDYATQLENVTYNGTSKSYTTANPNDVLVALQMNGTPGGGSPGTITLTGLSGATSEAHSIDGGAATAAQAFPTSGTAVTVTSSFSGFFLVVLKPSSVGWKALLPTWKNGGSALSSWAASINCSTGTTCSTDANGNITLTATGSGGISNPATLGAVTLQQISGSPATTLPLGSLSLSTSGPTAFLSVNAAPLTPARVQEATSVGSTYTVNLTSTPTTGNYLIGYCVTRINGSNQPAPNTGWTLIGHDSTAGQDWSAMVYKSVSGDPSSVTPCAGSPDGSTGSASVIEVSGIDSTWANSFGSASFYNNGAPGTISGTTPAANSFLVAFGGEYTNGGGTQVLAQTGSGWSNTKNAALNNAASSIISSQSIAGSGASYSSTVTSTPWDSFQRLSMGVLVLKPYTGTSTSPAALTTVSGSPTTNHCVKWASATSLADAGVSCGPSAPTTVSGLPSASTAGVGAQAFVTDATACTFGSTVTGGGSTACPVYSDGTAWKAG